jgi:hypothetical protein
VDQDTGKPVRVTIPISEAGFFSPSRDGRRLAYTQAFASGNFMRDERYIRYISSNRIMVFDRLTNKTRDIFRPGADDLTGASLSATRNGSTSAGRALPLMSGWRKWISAVAVLLVWCTK